MRVHRNTTTKDGKAAFADSDATVWDDKGVVARVSNADAVEGGEFVIDFARPVTAAEAIRIANDVANYTKAGPAPAPAQ